MRVSNVAVVKAKSLWKYPIGTKVIVNDVVYVYLSKNMDLGSMFYDTSSGLFVYEDEIELDTENNDIDIIVSLDVIDLKELYDIKVKYALVLVADGWSVFNGGRAFNMKDVIDELSTIAALIKITEDCGRG